MISFVRTPMFVSSIATHTLRAAVAALLIAATAAFGGCADGASDDAGAPSDDENDVDAGAGSGTCGVVRDGQWNASGACFSSSATVTVATSGCNLTFSSWNPVVDGPTSGAVNARVVSFTGGTFGACSGDLAGSGRRIDGDCPAAGGNSACTFVLEQ